jgi:hypothetical protein
MFENKVLRTYLEQEGGSDMRLGEMAFVPFTRFSWDGQVKDYHMGRECSTYGTDVSVGDLKERYFFEDWEDDVKMGHREVWWECVYWIHFIKHVAGSCEHSNRLFDSIKCEVASRVTFLVCTVKWLL